MLDGAAKIAPMLAEAQRLQMPAIGMTDHGNMFGASEFYTETTAAGIKPIIGIEAYIAPASRFDTRRVSWGDPSQKDDDVSGSGSYTHLTMLAENAAGLRNLFKLSSLASFEGQLGKWARMDAELIAEHADGIIATTGCPSGELQVRLRLGQHREALEAAGRWREIFGPDNYFLELMDHGLSIERRVREGLLEIGRTLGIRPLATNDCHYVTRDAAHNHEALLCVQTGKTLSDPNRFKFEGDGYYLKSAAEMRDLWDAQVPGACDTTLLIAERVGSYEDVWQPRNRMPVFEVPAGHDESSWLRHEVDAGLRHRFPDALPDGYAERAAYEIQVICDKGFPSYFLIVADLVELRAVGGHPRRPRSRLGRGVAGRVCARHHRHRPDPARPAVRALPQPRAHVDARHRHRLRRPPPRRDAALRHREVRARPRRPGDHVRYHQNQSSAEGFGAHPFRPAGLLDRRQNHQSAAAADHGQGHFAVGHHRSQP